MELCGNTLCNCVFVNPYVLSIWIFSYFFESWIFPYAFSFFFQVSYQEQRQWNSRWWYKRDYHLKSITLYILRRAPAVYAVSPFIFSAVTPSHISSSIRHLYPNISITWHGWIYCGFLVPRTPLMRPLKCHLWLDALPRFNFPES